MARWLVERGYDLYGKTDLRFIGFLENDCIQRELWQIWRSPVVNERLLVGWRDTAGQKRGKRHV